MKLTSLHLKNFRCFESLDLALNERCTVIAGVNGSGKSTILDAIAISVGTYFAKIPMSYSLPINKDDALRRTFAIGSVVDTQSQYPVVISSRGIMDGKELNWVRELRGQKNRTTVKEAGELIEVGYRYQKQIQEGDVNLVLPIIAYYGTGRLYKKKTNRTGNHKKKSTRMDGYSDALSSGTNEKQLFRWFEDMTLIQLQEGKLIPELEAVKKAMKRCFLSGHPNLVSDVAIAYSVKSKEIEITYSYSDGRIEKLPLHMFSDGIRITMTMVADIASRMAMLNPQLLDCVLETPGLVLIDEIDMHLHPSWQSKILNTLLDTFPNVQFITTTHSPIVISNLKTEYLRLLNNGIIETVENSYGKDIRDILQFIMGTEYRPSEVRSLITEIHDKLDSNDLSQAGELIDRLKELLGENDSEVIAAQTSLELENFFEELE
ncbi:AAA family ATPase [Streptococcus iners]|uniref:AAA family ATPase n=1 Tax=Streptococcus iners TaxID=3028084 RepID=A0AA96VK26_9STRE|nr:AAA family ATPase [Streptococcus sp. 29887]MCK4024640.1 AAA family ATPase [Streptococcus suis]WNY50397.1 AAA family ATPase [Streptococcus sp. 29887]